MVAMQQRLHRVMQASINCHQLCHVINKSVTAGQSFMEGNLDREDASQCRAAPKWMGGKSNPASCPHANASAHKISTCMEERIPQLFEKNNIQVSYV